MHRRILLSDVYQQSSVARPEAAAIDPENQFYWRFPRQRLQFEPLRDALLAVAGQLDPALGGRPVDIEPFSPRRSIYAQIDRNNFSSLLRTFDYPSPDATSPGRPVTTVPQQALFALNSPFLRRMAEGVAARVTAAVPTTDDRRPQIEALYRIVLSRDPSASELQLASDFLRQQPDDVVLQGVGLAHLARLRQEVRKLAGREPLLALRAGEEQLEPPRPEAALEVGDERERLGREDPLLAQVGHACDVGSGCCGHGRLVVLVVALAELRARARSRLGGRDDVAGARRGRMAVELEARAPVVLPLGGAIPALPSRQQARHLLIVAYLGSEVDQSSPVSALSSSKPTHSGSIMPANRTFRS